MKMRWIFLVSVFWFPLVGATCDPGSGDPDPGAPGGDRPSAPGGDGTLPPLSDSEWTEYETAIDDAMCYCQAWAFAEGEIQATAGECYDDSELRGHLARRATNPDLCDAPSDQAPHGAFPTRQSAGGPGTNGCAEAVDLSGEADRLDLSVTPGFCRADFNYCLANQLRLKADSFARAPSSREVREALLRESRVRFQRAATEYSNSLLYLGQACSFGSLVRVRHEDECTRLDTTPYPSVAGSRLADSLSQVAEVLADETRSREARADEITPGSTVDGTFSESMWGNSSPRIQAARIVMGGSLVYSEEPVFSPLPYVVAAERDGDAPYAARWRDDYHVTTALKLLVTYHAPVPHRTCSGGGGTGAGVWEDTDPDYYFNALDRQILAVRDPSGVSLPAPGDPVPLPQSPLRVSFGLTPAHVASAIDLLRDLVSTMDVDYWFEPTSYAGPSAATCNLDRVHIAGEVIQQRSPIVLAAGLAQMGVGRPDLFLPGTPPDRCDVAGGLPDTWYEFDHRQLTWTGAAGTVNIIRAYLLKILDLPGATWASEQALQDALALADQYVGDTWFEYRRVDPGTFGKSYGEWSVFGDDMPPGSPVYVGSEDEAYCLVRGHFPGRPANADCDALRASAPRMTGPLPAATFRVRDGVSFRLPEITALPRRLYILWQTGPSCPVGSDCIPAPGSAENAFTLVDVVPNTSRGSVHAFGGVFGDRFGQLMSKDPSNPASPAINSLGLASNLLPPLEHELIDDGDAFEDSFSYYLDYAEDSAREAAAKLEEARAEEIELLRSEAELAARRESAALAQEEVVAAVCGGDRPEAECDIERVPSITLGELGFISDPTIMEPPADDWRPTECPDLIATFSDEWRSVDKTDASAVKRLLMGGLECSRWLALLAIGNATLTNVPARVVTEWQSGGRGEFSDAGGQVRQEYIRIYQNFLDLRQAIDDIDDVYRTAKINITLTANEINRLESGFLEDAGCWLSTIGDSLMLVVIAAGTIVATVTTGPAGTAVGALIFAATLASSAGDLAQGLDALGRVEEICSEEEFTAQQKALAAFRDTSNSMDSMVEVLDDVARLITVIASADGNLRDLERRVEIARARRGIENRLAEATTSAGQSSWRALRGVKARRARDALTRAQRLSFIARRATEYRLVQDMRTLSVEEPFVAAPSTWVNEVFTLDTASSEPDDSATGSEPGARVLIAGEALEDYVHSLRDFVFGYPFHRRFSEGRDLQTVNLAALANAELPEIDSDGDGEPDPVDAEGVPASAFWKRMLYKCAGHDGLWLAGVLPDADGVVPNINDLPPDFVPCTDPTDESTPPVVEYAKYQFFIPSPLAGYFSERLADGNFNFRVNRVAVNVVGSAVLDCSRAARTEECYAGANIQYDMRQSGAVTLENFESEHLGFHSEPGVIARARALAAERYLTNPLSSADRALLTDYQRAEWWGRPLSGLYVVRIHGAPEIVWENLEDVQILLTYDYWTRQE